MGKRGPAKKPSALENLEGRPGKRPANKKEPKYADLSIEKCPDFLDAYAEDERKRLAPYLKTNGLLTVVDLNTFAAYCQSYHDWRTAVEGIAKHGLLGKNGSQVIPSPFVSMRNKALYNMRMMAQEFGFTPSSRTGIVVDPGDEVEPDGLAAHNLAVARTGQN